MTGVILDVAARGMSLLLVRARAVVDEQAIRQLSFGWERPALEVRAAWLVLHPLLSLQMLRNGDDEPPMDDLVDLVEVDDVDDDGDAPF